MPPELQVFRNRTLVVCLPPDPSDACLTETMRSLHLDRVNQTVDHIGLTLTGWGEDPRELVDIPEVRDLCRQLVDTGFVSYLDVSTSAPGSAPDLVGTFGAMEVYLVAEDRYRSPFAFTEGLLQEVWEMLDRANIAADAAMLIEDALGDEGGDS